MSILELSRKYTDYFLAVYGFSIPRSTLGKLLRSRLYIGEMEYQNKTYKTIFDCILKSKKEKGKRII